MRFVSLRVFFLLLPLWSVQAAFGQTGVKLRLAYQGHFLPKRTAVVVLIKPAEEDDLHHFQPLFFSPMAYPRDPVSLIRRDTLDANGRTSRLFSPTTRSHNLYFVYALTPDNAVYWSYSSKRMALKYDVVLSGVMSVAPVQSGVTLADVKSRFFAAQAVHEVHVTDRAMAFSDSLDKLETKSDGETVAELENAKGSPAVTAEARQEGIRLPYWAFVVWLVVPLAASIILAIVLVKKQKQVEYLRLAMSNLYRVTETKISIPKTEEDTEVLSADIPNPPKARPLDEPSSVIGNPIDPKSWNP